MKNLFLLIIALGIISTLDAQNFNLRDTKAPKEKILLGDVPTKNSSSTIIVKPEIQEHEINGRVATYIPLGTSGNAYGLYSNSRTYLWADPQLNSVVFTHRMAGGTDVDGNSRLAYDLSTDGGSTWNTDNKVYQPTEPGPQYPYAAGRYPQGVIVNPVGNTNPDNAWYSYLAAAIINTNGIWGGYVYGVNQLTQINPTSPTQHLLESGDGIYRLIPDAMTSTQDGFMWYVEPNTDYTSGEAEYQGNLIVGSGEIIDDDIVIEEELVDFLDPIDSFNDSKIAFAPDGQTGYMCFMSDSESDPAPYTNYHPILLKTTDGGETWSDPIHVQFGGANGIESIKNYWSDEILEAIYGAGFDRDEIYYNMGFSVDIIVDGDGNPHITGILAIADIDGWYPGEGTMATWHVYSQDGGDTWDATALYDNIFFDGDIGGLGMWNRPYAMSTYDGQCLFFSWIDTDLDGAEANTNPNIFVVGYDVNGQVYSEVQNVTELSLYWFSAFYGTGSQYVFADITPEFKTCEIPFAFTEYTVPGDPASEMNFIYIDGYTMDCGYVSVDENTENTIFSVAQNHPNPAEGITSILVTTETSGDLNLKINNILGQVVYEQSVNNKALGHTFECNVSGFESGVYFYTVEIGGRSITKKMIVR